MNTFAGHNFKPKGKNQVCTHCGKTEKEIERTPAPGTCKVATGKLAAGRSLRFG